MAPGDASFRLALIATAAALIAFVGNRRGPIPIWLPLTFVATAFALVARGASQKRSYREPLLGDGPRFRIGQDGKGTWSATTPPTGQRFTLVRFDFLEHAPQAAIGDAATAALLAAKDAMKLEEIALESVLEHPAGRAGRYAAEVLSPVRDVPAPEAKRAADIFERAFVDALRKAGVTGVRRIG